MTQPERVEKLFSNNILMGTYNQNQPYNPHQSLFDVGLCQLLFSMVRQNIAQHRGDDYAVGVPNILITDMPVFQIFKPLTMGDMVLQNCVRAVESNVYANFDELVSCYTNFLMGGDNKEIILYTIERRGENLVVRDSRINWGGHPWVKPPKKLIELRLKKHKFCGDF